MIGASISSQYFLVLNCSDGHNRGMAFVGFFRGEN